MAGETVTDPADPVREACAQLTQLMPRLAGLTPEPDYAPDAAGMIARPVAGITASPVPGNPPAFFAYTSIQASARWAEDLLLYAVGASTRDGQQGGSDAVTVRLLTEVIPKLAAGDIGDDTYGLVLRELEQRLDEARKVRAIDEAEEWRPVRSRACPYCGCYFLRVLLDAAKRPAGRIECFGHREDGVPCRAAWASLADIVPDLARADAETVPDLDG
jgi:hypothetical protein